MVENSNSCGEYQWTNMDLQTVTTVKYVNAYNYDNGFAIIKWKPENSYTCIAAV